MFFPPFNCHELTYKVRNTQGFNEMDEYYKLGFKKYIMGDFDQALMIFSF